MVLTHYAPHMDDSPWCALDMEVAESILNGYDLTQEEKTSLPAIMCGYCRLLDSAGVIGYGMTESEAILNAVRPH